MSLTAFSGRSLGGTGKAGKRLKKQLVGIIPTLRQVKIKYTRVSTVLKGLFGKDNSLLLMAHLRAKGGASDLPLSPLPATSLHCSVASPRGSRVSPTSECLSVSLGHL